MIFLTLINLANIIDILLTSLFINTYVLLLCLGDGLCIGKLNDVCGLL